MTIPSLPPQTNTLSTFCFGKLYIRLSADLPFQNCIYTVQFMHSTQSQEISSMYPLCAYQISCSLWHLHRYFKDCPKLTIEMHQGSLRKGIGNIHLPSMIQSKLTRSSRNLMQKTVKNLTIFQTQGNKEYGQITLDIWTQFNNKYSQSICDFIEPDLVCSQLDVIPISNINLRSQKEINLDYHVHYGNLQAKKPETDGVKDKKYSRINSFPSKLQKKEIDSKQMQMQMNDDIDKLIEEMQSKVYNSSKYQDSQCMSQLKNQSRGLKITQYSLNNFKTNGQFKPIQAVSNTLYSSNYNYNKSHNSNMHSFNSSSLNTEAKTLKIQVFELGSNGGISNQEQFQHLCNSQLKITFPNGYCISIPGQTQGETIIYSAQHQIPIQQVFTGDSSILFSNYQHQNISFIITSSFNGRELAIGSFQLERLLKCEGKGVFIIALNNRNKLQKSSSRVKISTSQLKTLKPANISMYNLRIGLQLVSSIKNKVYQLLLFVSDIQFSNSKGDNRKYELKYKTIGSLDNISVFGEEGNQLNHHMVMPVLLESIVKSNTKIVLEVWGINPNNLVGIVELNLIKIQSLLNISTGQFNDQLLNVNKQPLVLQKGQLEVRSIFNKLVQGKVYLGLYFGSAKQINDQLSKLTNKNRSNSQIQRPRKQVKVPYNEDLGFFIKQKKKEVREVQVQVQTVEDLQKAYKTNSQIRNKPSFQFKYKNNNKQNAEKQTEQKEIPSKNQEDEDIEDKDEDQFMPFVIPADIKNRYNSQPPIRKQASLFPPIPPQKETKRKIEQCKREQQQQQKKEHLQQEPQHKIPSPIKQKPIQRKMSGQLQHKVFQQTINKSKTLSEEYSSHIQSVLRQVLSLSPQFLSSLKYHLKEHIQFNFVDKSNLYKAIEESAPVSHDIIQQILRLVPAGEESQLISITPLYDYFTCMQITGKIDLKLISEELLGDFLVSRLIQQFMEDGYEECYLQQSQDVKEIFMKKNIYLTLRERDIFWKRYSRDLRVSTLETWKKIFSSVSDSLKIKQFSKIKRQDQQEQIMKQLYGCQQVPVQRHNYLLVTMKGMRKCIESTECLLGIHTQNIQIIVSVKKKNIIFLQDGTGAIDDLQIPVSQLQNTVGVVSLIIDGQSMSQTPLNLEPLVFGELEGTYPFKDKEGNFCGLVRLYIQHVE